MEMQNDDVRHGFRLYRRSDEDKYYWKDYYEDVNPIIEAIKRNIDQGVSITLRDVIESGGSTAADERHHKALFIDEEGLYSFADIQRRRQKTWEF
jgi:hypothetical protein